MRPDDTEGMGPVGTNGPCLNTDRHLWPDTSAPDAPHESLFVTIGGGIGINIGGHVIVMALSKWHELAQSRQGESPLEGTTSERIPKAERRSRESPALLSLNAVTPPQWISVEDRYPDLDQDIVYFFDVCGTYVGKYVGEHCFAGEAGFLTDDVTHWMPYYKPKRRAPETPAERREYHANGTYWSGVPTMDMPCDFCARPFVDHDPRTHACLPDDAWNRMFDAWVKHQAGLPSDVPLWPNPEWPQDVAMVAHALAQQVKTSGDSHE